jgi:acyl-CoA thioesterase-1
MIMAVKRRWICPVLAMTLAIALGSCGRNQQGQPAQSSTAATGNSAPHSEPPSPVTPDSRPVIVAFGDSLTAGLGVAPGKSYPDDLQRLLDAAGYNYRVVNMGVSGDTTTDGLQRLPDVLAAKPAIVILEFGGNDGLRGLPVSTSRAHQIQMIEDLRGNGVQILLAGMTLPRNYGADYIHAFEKVYVDLSTQYHLVRIPFFLDGVAGHPDLIQPDGIHPTTEGCRIVATNVMKYLQPLLKR